MNNLTTRKIVLGLLMVLVLAFSVQGTANAISALTRGGDADLSTEATNTNFDIEFSVTLQDIAADTTAGTPAYYQREAVSISVSGARINRIGSTDITPTGSFTLREDATSPNPTLTGSNTVRCIASSHGVVTVTIRDATNDRRSGDLVPPVITYTVYVTRPSRLFDSSATIRFANATNGVGRAFDDEDQQIYRGDSAHHRVTYNLDGGTFIIKLGDRSISSTGTTFTTSSAAPVYLTRGTDTRTVTAQVRGGKSSSAVYIYGTATLTIGGIPTDDSVPGQRLSNPLTATIDDGGGGGVARVPIKFEVANKTITGGTLIPRTATPATTVIDANNEVVTNPQPGDTIYARTIGTDGVASIDFQVGSASGNHVINVSAPQLNLTERIEIATTTTETARQLSPDGNQQRQGTNIFDLVALVENGGEPEEGVLVRFTTTRGLLTNTPANPGESDDLEDPDTLAAVTSKDVVDKTGPLGKAKVIYNAGDSSTGAEVVASISVIETGGRVIDLQEVIFNIRGGTGNQQQNQQNQQNQQTLTNRLAISPTSISGDPDDTETVTVTALDTNNAVVNGVPVTLSVPSAFTTAGGSATSTSGDTPFTSTLTLPDTADTYILTATAGGYSSAQTVITVTSPALGTLSISPTGTPQNGVQTVSITARTAANGIPSGTFFVALSGAGFTTASVPITGGSANTGVTLPTTADTYTLTVSATGYNPASTILVVGGGTALITTTTTTPTTPTTPTAEPSSIQISGPATRSGTVNTQLDSPLLARVLDVDGNGVPDARVIFRVRTGQGRLSARGNGRAIGVQTDSSGFARANYTPASASSTVEAEVRGVTRSVEFTITTGAAPTTTTRTPGTGTTPGTISPSVLVGAANRAPMLWIDGGAIYSLVGASVQRFAPGVDNAQNLAVGGGKIYWTEATGESGGTINSANLNGSGVAELASILATPIGIAVDTAGSKLYWTNSRGKIQSANLNGSGITDVIPGGLEGALDIALAGGNAYWTQGGNVRFVNLRGQKQIRNISTGTDTAGSLAIANGKVYWTEATGESGGTVNSANLNGSGATQLASILAAPVGIAVDTARSKLLWTNARGRIQSANLDGSGITNVVDGLGSPGDMVLSNSITAPAATTTTTTTTTTTADNSKYDVNNDGSVDNADASLVAAAMNTSNARYDVNGDGTVNFLDLLLVFDNRDPGAAGAPTIVGMKLTAVQVDVLQEQINLLIATGDRSPAAMRTLVYLQQLIATARPEQTQLLANYPNPFNPETWIPYELATDTDVRITIYNTHGVVIRTLELGHRSSGYYVGRDRAAYWDGRNAYGEQVASGIYFYQFETDTMSSMRKMVILK